MCPCNFRPTRAEAAGGRALWDSSLWCCCRAFCRALLDLQTVWKWTAWWARRREPPPSPTSRHPLCLVTSQSCLRQTFNLLDLVNYLPFFSSLLVFEQLAGKKWICLVTEAEIKRLETAGADCTVLWGERGVAGWDQKTFEFPQR